MFQKGDRVVFVHRGRRIVGTITSYLPSWQHYLVEDASIGWGWECEANELELEDPFAQWVKEVRNEANK